MKPYIEPQLYQKIFTRIGTPQDTAGLVALLVKRPEIVPMVEHHPRLTRHLLSINLTPGFPVSGTSSLIIVRVISSTRRIVLWTKIKSSPEGIGLDSSCIPEQNSPKSISRISALHPFEAHILDLPDHKSILRLPSGSNISKTFGPQRHLMLYHRHPRHDNLLHEIPARQIRPQ